MRDLASVGGVEGLALAVWTEKLCLIMTMSKMGYITICPDGKCSCIQYSMG